MKILLLAIVTLLLATPGVVLADGPINLSLVPSLQIVGQNTGSFTGVQWTAAGLVDGVFTGWQNSWLASVTKGNMQGLQVGAYTHSGTGSSGVQFGIFNTSDDFSGLQFGLVNITQVMRSGLQIGLINIIKSKEKLKLFPIVNWSF